MVLVAWHLRFLVAALCRNDVEGADGAGRTGWWGLEIPPAQAPFGMTSRGVAMMGGTGGLALEIPPARGAVRNDRKGPRRWE